MPNRRHNTHRGSRRRSHRGSWLRRIASTRVRAVLALGCLFGIGATGTLAYWTDSATVNSGTFTSGTLNMKVNSVEGNPTPYAWTAFTLTNMVPGESVAAAIPVQNVGSTDFTYTATATGTGTLLPSMRFTAYVGGTATNNPTGGLRTGTCSGTSMGTLTLTATAATAIGTAQTLSANTGTQNICVVAALVSTAPTTDQGKSASATYVFNAKQIGAP